ncbi:unnamed protein product [Clavelina lepadiformis]|uniref:G-protein coupled receptors family 1 profile domain-containing protein n=1 Tax=Clavelina lepadiformis TaxID=159417 RepID=A0ABP0FHX3_CLALP
MLTSKNMCNDKFFIIYFQIMSIDRYIAVCHPYSNRLQNLRTSKPALVVSSVTWAVAILITIPVMLYSAKVGTYPDCLCTYKFPKPSPFEECLQKEQNPETCSYLLELDGKPHNGEKHCRTYPEDDYYDYYSYDDENYGENYNGYGSEDDSEYTVCSYSDQPFGWRVFLIFNFTVMYLLPTLVLSVFYGLIIHKMYSQNLLITNESGKKSNATVRQEKDRRRVTTMCATLVISFVFCWIIFHVDHIAKVVGIHVRKDQVDVCKILPVVGTTLAYFNSALNPYLYNFMGTNFSKKWQLLKETRGIRQFISKASQKQDEESTKKTGIVKKSSNLTSNKNSATDNADPIKPQQGHTSTKLLSSASKSSRDPQQGQETKVEEENSYNNLLAEDVIYDVPPINSPQENIIASAQ